MLYLIGLGLDLKDLSLKALEIIKKCKKVYLEIYTNEFPYSTNELEKLINKKIEKAGRDMVEQKADIIEGAKKHDVCLLIYGSPLAATTHIELILRAKEKKIKIKVIHNSSVFSAIAETGLQLYKFGKTTSIPAWKINYKPTSFIDIVKENLSINAHTLLLVDIGLSLQDALCELKEATKDKINLNKIIICSQLGTSNQKIFCDNIEKLEKLKIKAPFCIIIPAKLHFLEKEALEESSWK